MRCGAVHEVAGGRGRVHIRHLMMCGCKRERGDADLGSTLLALAAATARNELLALATAAARCELVLAGAAVAWRVLVLQEMGWVFADARQRRGRSRHGRRA